MWLYRERKDDVIWSDLKLGGHLELNAILFQSWIKIRSNSKLPSIIVTNISRSSPHTTSWFTEVRHQHLKTNLQGLLSHVHILIVSKSNLSLFSRFVRTLIMKISSSEEPANSTSIHRVGNGGKLVILFHPSTKNITERCRSPSWKIGPQCVLVWDFIDKVFSRGFWAEANLSLTVSQLYYRGDIRPGINSLNSNFCAGIIWTNTDSQERSGVLTYTFIKQYAFPSLPGSFLACFWTFGNRLQQINYLLVA